MGRIASLFSAGTVDVQVDLVGDLPVGRAEAVAAALEDHYRTSVAVGQRIQPFERLPDVEDGFSPRADAYDEARDQYDAVEFALWKPQDDSLAHVWLTDVDLYASHDEHRNYVFGLALVGDRSCVVSTARLADDVDRFADEDEGFADEDWNAVAEQRLRKQVIKQFGRSLGAERCDDPDCVFYPADFPPDLDRVEEWICGDCVDRIGESHVR